MQQIEFKLEKLINKYKILYLQSLLIPTAKHFLNLQYWHRFLFSLITKHLPSRKHRYSICFWMLRRKNPCKIESQIQLKINIVNEVGFILNSPCNPHMKSLHNDNHSLYHHKLCMEQKSLLSLEWLNWSLLRLES